MRIALAAVLALAPVLALAACGTPTTSATVAEVTVFAAASLTDALAAVSDAYAEVEPTVHLTFSFDASSTLRVQIEQGAPADLFLSADEMNATTLVDGGYAADPVAFAGNQLAIVVPKSNPASIRDWTDLADAGLKLAATGTDVPIDGYAEAMLGNLAARSDAPNGFVASVEGNIASREDNVRAALAKVEVGEADAAIVYRTDALASPEVAMIAIPDEANVTALYFGAIVADADQATAAGSFLDWLRGPSGQDALAAFGFSSP